MAEPAIIESCDADGCEDGKVWPTNDESFTCCVCKGTGRSHRHRPDDMPEFGDRCRVCGQQITWMGPNAGDWVLV